MAENDGGRRHRALPAALVDGKPVETLDVRLTQTYYEPIEKPKSPDDTVPAPPTKP
jgi:hypothetical protein